MPNSEGGSSERIDRRRKYKKKSLLDTASLKIHVMHYMRGKNELNTKKLGLELDVYQSSISHVLRDLIEDGLVAKTIHGYKLTNLGEIQINLIDYLNKTLESLEENKDFFLTHNMKGIPVIYQAHIGMIYSQREYLNDDISMPYEKQEYLVEHLNNCREIRCMLSAVTSDCVKSISNSVKKGADVELILSDKIQQTLRRDYIHLLKDILVYDNLKTYRIKEVNFSLWVTESNLFLGLHRSDGYYDLENIIICKNENGLAWGNMVFNHYKNKAKFINNSAIW